MRKMRLDDQPRDLACRKICTHCCIGINYMYMYDEKNTDLPNKYIFL